MNESTPTKALMARLKTDLRGAEIIKHFNTTTGGTPDLSVSWMGATFWLEDKIWRKGVKLKAICAQNQLLRCFSLFTATGGKCFYVIYKESPKITMIWLPRTLAGEILPRMVMGTGGPHPMEVLPLTEVIHDDINSATMLGMRGCIAYMGWVHGAVSRLLIDMRRRPRANGGIYGGLRG